MAKMSHEDRRCHLDRLDQVLAALHALRTTFASSHEESRPTPLALEGPLERIEREVGNLDAFRMLLLASTTVDQSLFAPEKRLLEPDIHPRPTDTLQSRITFSANRGPLYLSPTSQGLEMEESQLTERLLPSEVTSESVGTPNTSISTRE